MYAGSSNSSSNAAGLPRTASHQTERIGAAKPRTRTDSDGLDRDRAWSQQPGGRPEPPPLAQLRGPRLPRFPPRVPVPRTPRATASSPSTCPTWTQTPLPAIPSPQAAANVRPSATISASNGSLYYPYTPVFDSSGNLWVTNQFGNTIAEYTPASWQRAGIQSLSPPSADPRPGCAIQSAQQSGLDRLRARAVIWAIWPDLGRIRCLCDAVEAVGN